MSAVPHASGFPTPNPSGAAPDASRAKSKAKGVFPPTPKSVRIWSVRQPDQPPPLPGTPSAADEPKPAKSSGPEGAWPWWLVVFVVGVAVLRMVWFLRADHIGR